jgi:ankyrin repeat protein
MPEHLENAIMENDYHYVEQRLNQFEPVPANSVNEALKSGLMIACQHQSIETVKVFLKKSKPVQSEDPSFCNVNLVDAACWTAVHYAAQSGSFECVKLLIENQAEIDATTDKNETALFLASKQNHLDIVEFLAENNCQLQTKALCKKTERYSSDTTTDKELTALEFAVKKNFVEIAKSLLLHLTRTKVLNKKELDRLLVKAAKIGHSEIAIELLINGANVNYKEGIISNFSNVFKFFFMQKLMSCVRGQYKNYCLTFGQF